MLMRPRVIPALLLRDGGLVKTVRFTKPTYLGDPINIVKLFNDKQVDELLFLDITATIDRRPPPVRVLAEIASECFMPLGYGGGVRTIGQIRELVSIGIEKIALNTIAAETPSFVQRAADEVGSQSIVVSIDVRKTMFGRYEVVTRGGRQKTGLDPVAFSQMMQGQGAGEILLTAIDQDGTMKGYDVTLIARVSQSVDIPVVACGGAGSLAHLAEGVMAGASAVAAASVFVFQGPHRAVLISYPPEAEIRRALGRKVSA